MAESSTLKTIILPVKRERRATHHPPRPAPPVSTAQSQETHPILKPSQSAVRPWKVLRGSALKQVEEMMAMEARILHDGDPGAVHALRVASRRFQQALGVLVAPSAPHEIRRLARRVKSCRDALSDLRNDDVLLGRARKTLGRKRTARRDAWRAVLEYLEGRHPHILRKAQRKLARANLAEFYLQTNKALSRFEHKEHEPDAVAGTQGAASAQRDSRPRHEGESGNGAGGFQAALARARESVWKKFNSRLEAARALPTPAAIHRVRIAVKQARYLAEIAHDAKVTDASEAFLALRDLQRLLGQWHNLEMLEQAMIETIVEGNLLAENLGLAMEIERLMLRTRKAKKALEERFFAAVSNSDDFRRLDRMMLRLGGGSEKFSTPAGGQSN